MASSSNGEVKTPIDLPTDEIEDIAVQAAEQALSLGLLMSNKQTKALENAPFALLPSPVPRSCFEQALELGPLFNLLVDRVSRDADYLIETLTPAAITDDFILRQLDLLRAAVVNDADSHRKEGLQTAALGLHRSDYMLHTHADDDGETTTLQQVEINTISAAFSSLGTTIAELHRFLCHVRPALCSHYKPDTNLARNASDVGHAELLAEAHKLYGQPDAVVLIVVLNCETNLFDQRKLEYLLWRDHGIRCIRRSLTQLIDGAHLNEETRVLTVKEQDRDTEVAIAYYRSCYMPGHYTSDKDWVARLTIERSRVIKCPTIGYQLAGSKKVQQDLAMPGRLERFFPGEPSIVAALRASFAGLFPLDDADAVARAQQNPGDFVLKPQREGGGNNIYDEELKQTLLNSTKEELNAYILMTRIRPQSFPMYIVRQNKVILTQAISELGIFGGFLGTAEKVITNKATGFLLRSKSIEHNDGGVAAGVACLDSPWLV